MLKQLQEIEPPRPGLSDSNKLAYEDQPAHGWYRFVLSYPPHLVRDYLTRFGLSSKSTVLDPFSGTGTTVVECKKQRIPSVGIEAHPMAHFACLTKTNWKVGSEKLLAVARQIAESTNDVLENQGIVDDPQGWILTDRRSARHLLSLGEEQMKLLLANSISPLPLHKTLVLREEIDRQSPPSLKAPLYLALARELVSGISNLHFGPEVGVGPKKEDAPVISAWLRRVQVMADDLTSLKGRSAVPSMVHLADAREFPSRVARHSIDAVITSPPYPNEKDYTRTTRLESVILKLINNKTELQSLKRSSLMRSNTRNVYKGDTDDAWVSNNMVIQKLASKIEARRIELGKTSGFERLYGKVTRLYFGGMARHFREMRSCLKPGAQLAYVVGDQASYFRIMIRTGQILAQLAEEAGYEVQSIDLFRTRLATATREQLREEVVVLRWPG